MFSFQEVLEEFVDASVIPPPKLKRRWWWKPNAQKSAATWKNATVKGRSETHALEHKTHHQNCCLCWLRLGREAPKKTKQLPLFDPWWM